MNTVVLISASASSAVLGLLIVVHHVVSVHRRHRHELLAQRLRPLVFRMLDDGCDTELVRLDRRSWAAIEPTVVSLLGNVAGVARDRLAGLLVRRGVLDSARRALHARRAHVRVNAAHVVGLLCSREDQPRVLPLLRDPHPDVRAVSARTLGRLGDARSARPLLGGLGSAWPVPTHIVVHALCALGTAAHPVLVDGLDHPHATVRAAAVEVLGLGGAVAAFPALVRLVRSDEALPVRLAAVRALARTGTPATAAVLVECAGRTQPVEVRIAVAEALGVLGDPSVADVLGLLLTEQPHRLAHNASRSLLRLGERGRAMLARAASQSCPHAIEALAWDRIEHERLVTPGRSHP